jgi:hypothetical protein
MANRKLDDIGHAVMYQSLAEAYCGPQDCRCTVAKPFPNATETFTMSKPPQSEMNFYINANCLFKGRTGFS